MAANSSMVFTSSELTRMKGKWSAKTSNRSHMAKPMIRGSVLGRSGFVFLFVIIRYSKVVLVKLRTFHSILMLP